MFSLRFHSRSIVLSLSSIIIVTFPLRFCAFIALLFLFSSLPWGGEDIVAIAHVYWAVHLRPHLDHCLLEAVVVASPGVPVDPVSEGPVGTAQIPAIEVGIVAVAVPPSSLEKNKGYSQDKILSIHKYLNNVHGKVLKRLINLI